MQPLMLNQPEMSHSSFALVLTFQPRENISECHTRKRAPSVYCRLLLHATKTVSVQAHLILLCHCGKAEESVEHFLLHCENNVDVFLMLDRLKPTTAGLDAIPAWFLHHHYSTHSRRADCFLDQPVHGRQSSASAVESGCHYACSEGR